MKALLPLALALAAPALAQHAGHEGHSGHDSPAATAPDPHAGHDMSGREMPADAMSAHDISAHDRSAMSGPGHSMRGALGPYAMDREASGTAWQPDSSVHQGLHINAGEWMVMLHALLNGVYDRQTGPRGDSKAFASGMVMGMAQRPVGASGTFQLRTMISPDPLMGASGYPLLLASGETADGRTPLIDRQHPHDLFMELSASYSHRLSDKDSLFVYAGLPGEPAFGPPAFMHRLSIMDSPEAPITHHWLDSTHITYGVLTLGWTHGPLKVEASRFRGREPDEHRWDFEVGALDSTAVRVSLNPTRSLSLQASWARQKSPEQLEPDEDVTKWSGSAMYTRALGEGVWWSSTVAWGRRSSGHEQLDAFLVESAFRPDPLLTFFARAEATENNELVTVGGHHGPTYRVAKMSFGGVRDFVVAGQLKLGIGGLYAFNFVPEALKASYGDKRRGMMAFIRLRLD